MTSIEIKASSIEKAVEQGLQQLGLTQSEVEVEVLRESGFLKKAIVKLTVKTKPIDVIFDFIESVLEKMGLDCQVELVEEPTKLLFNIRGTDANLCIGHHGEVLDNLQYLTQLVANIDKQIDKKVIMDAENYREKRTQILSGLAKKLAFKASKSHRVVELEPMNPYERRIIHTALQEDTFVTTSSKGEEPNRYVVITPNKVYDNNRDFGQRGDYNRNNDRNRNFNRNSDVNRNFNRNNDSSSTVSTENADVNTTDINNESATSSEGNRSYNRNNSTSNEGGRNFNRNSDGNRSFNRNNDSSATVSTENADVNTTDINNESATSSEGNRSYNRNNTTSNEGGRNFNRNSDGNRSFNRNNDNNNEGGRSYSDRRNSYNTPVAEPVEKTVEVEQEKKDVDIYDSSARTQFKKTGMGKSRSFGGSKRKF